MEDMIEQYTKAASELRQLIREAHEVLKDLRTESQVARNAMRQYESEALATATKRAKEAEENIWRMLKQQFETEFDSSFVRIKATLDKATNSCCSLIADSAETLAMAIQVKDVKAMRTVASIARNEKRRTRR